MANLFAPGVGLSYFLEKRKTAESAPARRFLHFMATTESLELAARLLSVRKSMKTPDGADVTCPAYVIHFDGKHNPTDAQTIFIQLKGETTYFVINTHLGSSG